MNAATPPAGERPGPHAHASVGPLVEEAALLLGAVEDKLQAWQTEQTRSAASTDDPAPGEQERPGPCPECGSTPGAPCTGCPVCRLLAAVRGERPEVTARVVDGTLTVVRALRTLFPVDAAAPSGRPAPPGDAADRDTADGPPAPPTRPPTADRPARPAGLQHIDIT